MNKSKNLDEAVRNGFSLAIELKNNILDKHIDDKQYGITIVVSVMQCLAHCLAEGYSIEFVEKAIDDVLNGPELNNKNNKFLN